MKKKVFTLLALMALISVSTLNADLRFGIKAAGGTSAMAGRDWESALAANNVENKLAFSYGFGAYLNLGLLDFFSLQPEFLYSSYAFRIGDSSYWVEDRMTMFELPVYAQIHFGSLVLQGGPNFSYASGLIKSKDSTGAEGSSSVSDFYDEPFAIGFAAGLAYFSGNVQFGVVYKRTVTEMVSAVQMYPQSLNLELGYTF